MPARSVSPRGRPSTRRAAERGGERRRRPASGREWRLPLDLAAASRAFRRATTKATSGGIWRLRGARSSGRADQPRVVEPLGGRQIRLHLEHDDDEAGVLGPVVPVGRERGQEQEHLALAELLFDDQRAFVAGAGDDLDGLLAAGLPAVGHLAIAIDLDAADQRIGFALEEREDRMVGQLQVRLAGIERGRRASVSMPSGAGKMPLPSL